MQPADARPCADVLVSQEERARAEATKKAVKKVKGEQQAAVKKAKVHIVATPLR